MRCFRRAAEADPACAMAHWGIAYAIGPNYNKDWEAFEPEELVDAVATRTRAVATARMRCSTTPSPVERALIEALRPPLPGRRRRSRTARSGATTTRPRCATSTRGFADDLDVAALFAEALIEPHARGSCGTSRPASRPRRRHARGGRGAGAGDGRDRRRPHPGLLHMYIHAMEMSPHPERALPAADRLRGLVPDAGHLQHMPTHIDVLCGHYRDVIAVERAGDRRRPQVPGARGRAQLLLALPLPQLSLQDLRRDVPGPARAGAGGGRRAGRDAARGAAARSRCRRWPTGWRGSCRCGCTC